MSNANELEREKSYLREVGDKVHKDGGRKMKNLNKKFLVWITWGHQKFNADKIAPKYMQKVGLMTIGMLPFKLTL